MLIPDKSKKIQQENFKSYSELRDWMHQNGFKNKGYVLEEPWKEFFVERWEKDTLFALSMNITDLYDFMTLSLELMNKPFQVDIAQKD